MHKSKETQGEMEHKLKIIFSLAILSIAFCDRLDNKYLPPKNAFTTSNDYPSNTPIVDNVRFAHQPNNQFLSQASEPKSQYSAPNGQNLKTNDAFTNFNGEKSEAKVAPISRQYLFPANQQSSGGLVQPSGSSTIPASQYSRPSGQLSSFSQRSEPFGQSTVTNNQYSKPNEEYSGAFQNPKSTGQPAGPLNQFSKPKTSQYREITGQYPKPTGQFSGSFQQPSTPFGQYSKPSGAEFGSQFGPSPAAGQYSRYNAQVPSGKYNDKAGFGIIRSSSMPNSGDGYYSYSYETENGISAQEEGALVNDAENAHGSYSYTSPEGEQIVVEYTADENGFHPTGSHIPQIPDAILKSIEINKAAEARGEYQEGRYSEENDGKYAKNGYNPKFASPASSSFNGFAPQGPSSDALKPFSSEQSDRFPVKPLFGQNGYQNGGASYGSQNNGKSNGSPQFGGFSSIQQQKSDIPQLNFAASEPSRVQFEAPKPVYGVPSAQYATVQDNKGGYKY